MHFCTHPYGKSALGTHHYGLYIDISIWEKTTKQLHPLKHHILEVMMEWTHYEEKKAKEKYGETQLKKALISTPTQDAKCIGLVTTFKIKENCWLKAGFARSHISFTEHEKKKKMCRCTSTQHAINDICYLVSDVVAENQNLRVLVSMRHLVITFFIPPQHTKRRQKNWSGTPLNTAF